ncbi:DUF1198 family protein [Vreelandella profundi]|uniref:DUF1198 family protein n=1 Tax=Vreelandella profundi TaxID=2852117 RepID=UPI001EEFB5F3|nr:DUF1198 family protein [Halomonas profundi]
MFGFFKKNDSVADRIGHEINIKPEFVEEMVSRMGAERGKLFLTTVSDRRRDPDVLEIGIKTFFIYQVIKNSHPKNVLWWQSQLAQSSYSPDINIQDVEAAFMFLRDAGADISLASEFLHDYKKHFM